MKKIWLIIPLIFCIVSCTEVYRYTNETFFAMNTVAEVIKNCEIEQDDTQRTVDSIENLMSRTRQTSEIFRVNNGEDIVLSYETAYVLEKALEISKNTDYAFNPCMGALTDLWDITSGENYVPTDEEINAALALCDASSITICDGKVSMPDGMKIDLGGVAKGYALEISCKNMLDSTENYEASADYCISLGGNIGVGGSSKAMKNDAKKGWKVGIANPFGGETTVGSVIMTHGCIAVSGGYERYFEKDGVIYHHIFDPKTGKPAQSGLASAAVICDDGLLGDALSTALFVMGQDEAIDFYHDGIYDFEMILVTQSGDVLVTENLADDFVLNKNVKSADNMELKLEIIH